MTSPHTTYSAPSASHSDGDPAAAGTGQAHDTGLLLLRVVLGLTMAVHGSQKLFGAFDGPGLKGTGQFFSSAGYPAGETMALIAGLTETLGGLGLALGLLTPLAGAAVLGTMVNAIALKWGGGFFAPKGVEYELLLIAGAAALTLTGPGRYAADRLLPVLRAHRLTHGAAAVVVGVVVAAGVLMLRD
ncbi:DoxX family protein [Streptomyces albidus (ex Kaewkla and Franco 2022)]|uniref:DoxX family protein n=1 Tax=Streptomyces albidus (ex Kaewkla and Franco 2022) TaxID=722709 RepID=UPI0015EF1568|nr:DoxX family protein [Streptomyces albidus (ex Kaewkla and Franco 2022)]